MLRIAAGTTDRSGVRFLDRTPVLLASEKWRVVVELNVSGVYQGATQISEAVQQLGENYRRAASHFSEIGAYRDEIEQMREIAREVSETAFTLRDLLPSGRVRRGLINVGGKVLKVLFGTPDADDVDDLQGHLAKLEQNKDLLVHLTSDHLTLTRTMGKRVEDNSKRITRLTENLSQELGTVHRRVVKLEGEVRYLTQLLNFSLPFLSNVRNLETAVLRASTQLKEMYQGLEWVARGVVSPSLLPPAELGKILRTIANILPDGLSLIAGVGAEDAHRHYQAATAHGLALNGVLQVIIELPLQARDQRFDLFTVRVLPVLDRSLGKAVVLRTNEDYLLVSEDREYYAPLRERDLKGCQRGHPWICSADFPLHRRRKRSCLSVLFYGEGKQANTACDWTVLAEEHNPTWVWDGDRDLWLFSLPEPVLLTTHCKGHSVAETVLQGQGEFVAPEGCAMRTPDAWFLPTSQGVTHLEVEKTIKVWPPVSIWRPTRLPEEQEEPVPAAIQQLREDGLSSLGDWGTDEVHLGTLQETVRRLAEDSQHWRKTGWYGGGTALVAAVLTLSFVGYWCYQKRRPTAAKEEDPEGPAGVDDPPYHIQHPSPKGHEGQ